MVRKEGVLHLYRGIAATLAGVAPYTGLKFAVYAQAKFFMSRFLGEHQSSLACAGFVARRCSLRRLSCLLARHMVRTAKREAVLLTYQRSLIVTVAIVGWLPPPRTGARSALLGKGWRSSHNTTSC